MFHCPKCNSYRISGPRYERTHYGEEALRYTCIQCGYSETTRTHDADSLPETNQKGEDLAHD